jgi:BioD-like phosphotransacetylase family protein
VINAGEMQTRRVKSTTILARTVPNLLRYFCPSRVFTEAWRLRGGHLR